MSILSEINSLSRDIPVSNEYNVLKKYFENEEKESIDRLLNETFKYIITKALNIESLFTQTTIGFSKELELTRK